VTVYGGIETGGSKWELAVGTGLGRPARDRADSDDDPGGDDRPRGRVLRAGGPVDAVGIGSPERIVIGGVTRRPSLLPRVREEVVALVNGYLDAPAVGEEIATYITRPALEARAGVLGAIALAQRA
jgi:hypothetical protein